ncbi:hypothetical protein [Methylobacterium sp. ID0610]|uniref:hypothetical protein n=1 Tax=Methylobacterium carpenticola TaxID=3344827 RepID=UPI00368A44CA
MYHEARSRNGSTSPGDLGRMLGEAVRLHRRIDEASSEVKGDRDKEMERERAMELVSRRIEALQEAISHGRARTLSDALAQTVIAYGIASRIDEDPDVNLKQACAELHRVLFSIASALEAHTGLTVKALGADYIMPAWADYLAPWYAPDGIVKLGLPFDPPPVAEVSTFTAELIRLEREYLDWLGVYDRACDLKENRGAPATLLPGLESATKHAVRKQREAMRFMSAIPGNTALDLGLKARVIAREVAEWWDDEDIGAGERACRALLDELMARAGLVRVPREDITPKHAESEWIAPAAAAVAQREPARQAAPVKHSHPAAA